ncbi:MAG TPA: hypothetical protein ENJ86_09750 [Methylothermaceae bacterium]|nr:hypothetical protein [Methylothermaceae bacterium]
MINKRRFILFFAFYFLILSKPALPNVIYDAAIKTLYIPNVKIGEGGVFYCSITLSKAEKSWRFKLNGKLHLCPNLPVSVISSYHIETHTLSIPRVFVRNGENLQSYQVEMLLLPSLEGIQLELKSYKHLDGNPFSTLPANRWTLLSESDETWTRQGHSGAAFDPKRNKIYLFGSDTHSTNFDNTIHEFDLNTLKWSTHYPEAPVESYRADEFGRAISGVDNLFPWAMHTFDNVVYDPNLDALVVTARPNHNYKAHQVAPDARIHPTWIYDLPARRWHILENNDQPYPVNFAGSTAYDSHRDVIVSYSKDDGIYELGPERKQWQLATNEKHHEIHYSMEYDPDLRAFVVFGDFHGPREGVWIYYPGAQAGEPGRWEELPPQGDTECHSDEHFPVAYSSTLKKFLLMPRDHEGKLRFACLYDATRNTYERLPTAGLVTEQNMNYMMVYSPNHDVFLLVTGSHNTPIRVWAIRILEE